MKSVLISIQPKWCELIASGKKTIEVRKTAPKDKEPFKVYIYQTKKKWIYRLLEKLGLYQGKVIGEFVCDKVCRIPWQSQPEFLDYDLREIYALNDPDPKNYFSLRSTCLTQGEIIDYGKGKTLYGWHISDLKIYDKPKELSEFKFPCQYGYNDINNAWCYRERGIRLTMCKYNDMENSCCKAYLTRPPQSWCYVEE